MPSDTAQPDSKCCGDNSPRQKSSDLLKGSKSLPSGDKFDLWASEMQGPSGSPRGGRPTIDPTAKPRPPPSSAGPLRRTRSSLHLPPGWTAAKGNWDIQLKYCWYIL